MAGPSEMSYRIFLSETPFRSPPRIHNQFYKDILVRNRNPPPTHAGQTSSEEYEKMISVGDTLLHAIVACTLHTAFPEMTVKTAQQYKVQLTSIDTLSRLSKKLTITRSGVFDDPTPPRDAANVLKAYVAAVYLGHLKDGTKRAGDAVNILEAWLSPVFVSLASNLEVQPQAVASTEEILCERSEGVPHGLEIQEAILEISDDTNTSPTSLDISKLHDLRNKNILDFTAKCEAQKVGTWQSVIRGRHRGVEFCPSIVRAQKKDAERAAAHLVLRKFGLNKHKALAKSLIGSGLKGGSKAKEKTPGQQTSETAATI
ncbi:hypothetical protein BD324DRAFT_649026 [Kockovaella imperatae]|uniref:RNase III domain-containing protein n=1 Tax=Kockovaella imperatae TaxID=4999 RepID=A0A1Y1UN89_9TREE|nr:hypothetical protein BD324DRAFT_649026 [Kockovaella imperatae]ORX38926.1 hypothetical protein BD324DRAFT_649026 [Kockovaella imperatae]